MRSLTFLAAYVDGLVASHPQAASAYPTLQRFVSANTDPLLSLTQYGPLGLMVLGFLSGWIVPGPAAKQKDAEIARLQGLFEDQVLPMASEYARTMADATRVLENAINALGHAKGTGT